MFKPLPIGVDSFEKLITNGYYYVDKTLLIKEILDNKGEVNLFTRPRRFGKTLNMSMLQSFFEKSDTNQAALFDGLEIMSAGERYTAYMGQYPVINLSLKGARQADYDKSYYCLKDEIAREYKRHLYILKSEDLKLEREKYHAIMMQEAADAEYLQSIRYLSECLYQYYGRKVIILIDEYDVPLENSYFSGFYEKMSGLLRALFESALKTNPYLEFAVLTGCLRISKESIFTGLNNLKVISILNRQYGEYFGFTEAEIRKMLVFYNREGFFQEIKSWYDGYLFGMTEVYNPWSVISYVDELQTHESALPRAYWAHTSENRVIRTLIERADLSVRSELETLISGGMIEKAVHEDITYEDVYCSEDNLWNFLFFTGYLKKVKEELRGDTVYLTLKIPNTEVRYIYKNHIMSWFMDKIQKSDFSRLYSAILDGSTEEIGDILSEQLMDSISYYDGTRQGEDFYHGFLLGILKNMKNYIILSNREAGNGRPDIVIKYPSVRGTAVIMELKVSDSYEHLPQYCEAALEQIESRRYMEGLRTEGYQNIIRYGVAFYRKDCMVRKK